MRYRKVNVTQYLDNTVRSDFALGRRKYRAAAVVFADIVVV